MSTTIKTVALAGASGSLGTPVLKALLDAGFIVTVLARPGSSTSYPAAVNIAAVDYADPATLVAALTGQDAVVSTVGYAAFRGQEALIDAAIAAGVKRILPSEYGADPDHAPVRQLPVFADKLRIAEYVQAKTRGTPTSYTLVANNEFFDWDLDHAFGVDLKGKKMEIFDGGDVRHTITPVDFVARGIAAVLRHPAATADRAVRLHGATMTQNELLAIIQRFTGTEGWQVSQVSTLERERQGYDILQKDPSNWMGWALAFLQVSIWGERYKPDFSAKNDNALLGLTELTDAEVEAIVRSRC